MRYPKEQKYVSKKACCAPYHGGLTVANCPPVHGKVNIMSVRLKEGCCLHFLVFDGRGAGGAVKMWASEVERPIFWGSDQSIRW